MNLKQYRTAVLSAEEEKELFLKYQRENCLKSAEKIVVHHLGLVASIAHKFRGYDIPHEDLFQTGVIGLMKAVKAYDLNKGVRFVTYALTWIRSEMLDYVEKNVALVKRVTTHSKSKIFYNLKKYVKADRALNPSEIKMIAKTYDVKEDEVRDMEASLFKPDVSINAQLDDSEDTFADIIVGAKENEYFDLRDDYDRQEIMKSCLSALSDKERDIITQRYLLEETVTRQEIGKQYGVSHQYIEQVEKSAINKMKKVYSSY